MEENRKKSKSESGLKGWFSRMFCIGQMGPQVSEGQRRCSRISKLRQKQKIHMSLLGSYKACTLCKISRKNFIVEPNELQRDRLPSSVSKHLSDKISSTTAIVKGQISAKVTKRIPCVLKLVEPGEKCTGECVQGTIKSVGFRAVDLCIYRPKLPLGESTSLLDPEAIISEQIRALVDKFNNSVLILPKETILDEIGVILSNTSKFIEVETLVVNGLPLCQVVYVGCKEFVLISENEQIQFVVKELKKDLLKDDPNIADLVRQIHQKSSMRETLRLLRMSIHQAYIDTIFSCFLRNAINREYISPEQASHLFPGRANQLQDRHTPSLRLTARFNVTTSNFKHSCSEQFLNGPGGQLQFNNQVETFADTELQMKGMDLIGQYDPYL